MSKLMPVDVLSSIKGAQESESVNKLFEVIKSSNIEHIDAKVNAVSLNDLREDVVVNCDETTKNIIKENFPKEKNGYLVVNKVIEG